MVCTANQCRSPMAAALLSDHLREAGVEATVGSAGLLEGGAPATAHGVAVMEARGLDTSAHCSRRLAPEILARADLVVAMERQHVREVALVCPPAWPRAFTLKELVRRGGQAGPRAPGQTLDEWLDKVHAGRMRSDLLGSSPLDDIADPVGGTRAEYEETAAELDQLTADLVALAWGKEGP